MLGERIRIIRKLYKLNQIEFGRSLNVSKQAVSNWEHNRINPSISIIKDIALKYNVSSDFLLGLDDRLTIHIDKNVPDNFIIHIQNLINDVCFIVEKSKKRLE